MEKHRRYVRLAFRFLASHGYINFGLVRGQHPHLREGRGPAAEGLGVRPGDSPIRATRRSPLKTRQSAYPHGLCCSMPSLPRPHSKQAAKPSQTPGLPPKGTVVVIGAGLAGLAAARQLLVRAARKLRGMSASTFCFCTGVRTLAGMLPRACSFFCPLSFHLSVVGL